MTSFSVPAEYINFCQSPLRTEEEICNDFQSLLRNPFVVEVGFHKPHIMMVQTDTVIVPFEGEEVAIGDFLIFLIREQDDQGYWYTDFFFSNVTNSIPNLDETNKIIGVHHHPHIISEDPVSDIDQEFIGELCIQHGGHMVRQALRMGKVTETIAKLKTVLHTMDTGTPFLSLKNWKIQETGDD